MRALCRAGRAWTVLGAVLALGVAAAAPGADAAAKAGPEVALPAVGAHADGASGQLPVEIFNSLWAAGKCEALGAMLAPTWTYDVANTQNASGPPFTITRATFLANATGFCWRLKFALMATNVGRVGMTSYANVAGFEIMAPAAGSASPGCMVPHAAIMTTTVDAKGMLLHTAKSFNGPHFTRMLDHCAKEVPLPVPSATPGAMPLETFAGLFLDLVDAGQCKDAYGLLAVDFEAIDGPGSMPIDRAHFAAACAGAMTSSPASLRTQAVSTGNGTVVLSGGGGVLVTDPRSKSPCGIAYPMSAILRVRPCATSGLLEVVYLEFVFDMPSYLAALSSQCGWVPGGEHR